MLSLLDAPFDLRMSDCRWLGPLVDDDDDCLVLDAERRARIERDDDPDLDDVALLELSHDPADVLILDAVKRKRAEHGRSNTGDGDVDILVRDAERRAAAEKKGGAR